MLIFLRLVQKLSIVWISQNQIVQRALETVKETINQMLRRLDKMKVGSRHR